ncbi:MULTISPECIES: hypothetical protein [unclassified Sphingomonas]|uniref:hypothetical protein n=1 Tax=unclassified Sphingomonas TaxID=196159 RepID=UPI0006FEE25C|nr:MULTISPECIES: hypothetical protein [unclassified Sphingomonas]KQN22796.1 hypothetical protein ASE83_15520 [Sphingomonas sp. Leaf32]
MADRNQTNRKGRRKLWRNMQTAYEIRDARIVGAVDGGGALVETRDVIFKEGRVPLIKGSNADHSPALEYMAGFAEPAVSDDPQASAFNTARIVIAGTHAIGRIEIRGQGWIGYDECGLLAGWFENPPAILIDAENCERPRMDPTPALSREVLSILDGTAPEYSEPNPSAEYLSAVRGIELKRQ